LLEFDLPSVKNVHEWNWENVWLGGTSKVGNVGVKRNLLLKVNLVSLARLQNAYLLSSGGLGNSQRDTENGISTERSLVWGSIELDQELIDLGLIFDIDVLLDKSWANNLVDVGNGLGNTLSCPLALVSITELNSFVLSYVVARISFTSICY
jgi:hypothetical protein